MNQSSIEGFCDLLYDLFDASVSEFSISSLGAAYFRKLIGLLEKSDLTEACNSISDSFGIFVDEDVVYDTCDTIIEAAKKLI